MREKPIWHKIFENQKSYELSAHFRLLSFKYVFCRFSGKIAFQIKPDLTRVIKKWHISSCDIFELYTNDIKIENSNKVWSRIVLFFHIINGGTNFWYFLKQKLYKIVHEQTTLNCWIKILCRPVFLWPISLFLAKLNDLPNNREPVNLFKTWPTFHAALKKRILSINYSKL